MVTDDDVTDIISTIAQGVINIDSGYTTIEKDSRVYRAMSDLLKLINDGAIEIKVVR